MADTPGSTPSVKLPENPDSGCMIPLGGFVSGGVYAGIVYLLSTLVTPNFVPQHREGYRRVFDIPWPDFAWLPTEVAGVVLLLTWALIWFLFRSPKFRIFWLIGAGTGMLLFHSQLLHVARRIYIDKF